MFIDIKIPEVGESITEGLITEWMVQSEDYVKVDEPLYELETDKITMVIMAEAAGKVIIDIEAGSKVNIGQVVGKIDTSAQQEKGSSSKEEITHKAGMEDEAPKPVISDESMATPKQVSERTLEDQLPSVRRLAMKNKLDLSLLKGTGKGGRITKGDVLQYLESEKRELSEPSAVPQIDDLPQEKADIKSSSIIADNDKRETRKQMSSLRARIAERMLDAKNNTAMLTTFNEVDMSAIISLRDNYKEAFNEKYGVKLGIMSFFVKAVVDALMEVPEVNVRLEGTEIVYQHYYDIGIAVSTDRGLVVPVIREVDKLTFAEIEQQLLDLSQKARNKTLTLDDLRGGVYTISNGGIFGSLLSTPILNPPQCGILGMHAIKKRPVVVGDDDRIEVRPMMYLAMSYDHRLIDGREAVTFLLKIKNCIEAPERKLIGI